MMILAALPHHPIVRPDSLRDASLLLECSKLTMGEIMMGKMEHMRAWHLSQVGVVLSVNLVVCPTLFNGARTTDPQRLDPEGQVLLPSGRVPVLLQ